jgi:phasin family protein
MAKRSSADTGNVTTLFDVPIVVLGVDLDAVIASQRRNIEALTEANKVAIEGIQAVVRRQFEIGSQTVDEISTIVRDLVQPTRSVEDRVAKQAEYSKQAIEKGLSNALEIGELVKKASTEAVNVLGKRVAESIDEVRNYATKHVAAR